MTKELRISATVQLPDDFDAMVALLAKAAPAIKALSEALGVKVEAREYTAGRTRKPTPGLDKALETAYQAATQRAAE